MEISSSAIGISIALGLGAAMASSTVDSFAKSGLRGRRDNLVASFFWMLLTWPFALAAALVLEGGFPASWLSNGLYAYSFVASLLGAVAFEKYYRGVQAGRVSVMASLNSLSSVILVGLCAFYFGEEMSGKLLIAGALAIAGTALSVLSAHKSSKADGIGFPELPYLMFTIPFFAICGFLNIVVLRQVGVFWELAIDRGIFLSCLALVLRDHIRDRYHKPASLPWVLIVIISVFNLSASVLSGLGNYYGIRTIVIPLSSTGAAFTALIGTAVFHEKLATNQKIGLALVVAAVIIASI